MQSFSETRPHVRCYQLLRSRDFGDFQIFITEESIFQVTIERLKVTVQQIPLKILMDIPLDNSQVSFTQYRIRHNIMWHFLRAGFVYVNDDSQNNIVRLITFVHIWVIIQQMISQWKYTTVIHGLMCKNRDDSDVNVLQSGEQRGKYLQINHNNFCIRNTYNK